MRQATAVSRLDVFEFGEGVCLGLGEAAVGPLEDGPAQGFGQLAVLGLGAADVIDRLGEHLDDVEPVDGDGGVLEGLADGGEEGATHVADDLGDARGPAAVLGEEGLEAGHGLLAAAGRDEDDRLVLGVEVDEDGDVGLAALGGGLVEADR